jgi:hypothetical protein
MESPLKPLLPFHVDANLNTDAGDDRILSPSDLPPRYRALSTSQPDDDDRFVEWWKKIRSDPKLKQRESILIGIRAWSPNDRRRNAIHVRKAMVLRSVFSGSVATMVRKAGAIRSAGTGADVLRMLGAGWLFLSLAVDLFHRSLIANAVIVSLLCAVFGACGASLAPLAAVTAHLALRVHLSLRISDDTRIYIPPAALLVHRPRFVWRQRFYSPVPFIPCEDMRELGARISALEFRLRAQESSGADPFGLSWSV